MKEVESDEALQPYVREAALRYSGHSHQDRPQQNTATLDVRWTCLKGTLSRDGDDQRIFQTLYGFNGGRDAFWLDRCAERYCS